MIVPHETRALALAAVVLLMLAAAGARAATIQTIAGTGAAGFSGDDGPATAAQLFSPGGLCRDPAGNIFFTDTGNHRVRRIDAVTGIITTFAGTNAAGYSGDNGPAIVARLNSPQTVVCDASGNVFIVDMANHRIRRVDSAGVITTVAGDGNAGSSGNGGPAISARLNLPRGVTVDSAGNLFIADTGNRRIRRVDAVSGFITLFAGDGGFSSDGDGGLATAAGFASPYRTAVDTAGHVFVADRSVNSRIRRIDAATSIVTTVAGGGAVIADSGVATNLNLGTVNDLALASADTLLVAASARVWRVNLAAGTIAAYAGTGVAGFGGDGGDPLAAQLSSLGGVASAPDGGAILSDTGNHRIRSITNAPAIPYDLIIGEFTPQSFLDGITNVEGSVIMIGVDGTVTLLMPNLTTVGTNIVICDNNSLTNLTLPVLADVGGNLVIKSNLALSTIGFPALTNVNDDVIVTDNGGAAAVDLSGLGSVGGSVIVTGNGGAVDLSGLTNAGADVIITGNGGAVDLSGLASAGGDVVVIGNGGAVVLPGDASVGGDVVIETSGGVVDFSGLNVTGNTTVTTSATNVTANTGGGATAIQQASATGASTLTIPAGAFAAPITFSVVVLGDTGAAAGTNAQSAPAAIDPLTSTEYTVPTLPGAPAAIEFGITLALLDSATRSNVLAGLAEGRLTVARKSSGGAYAAMAACGAGETATNGCAEVTPRDANGTPIPGGSMEVPATISFRVLTTTFSTWAPALVYAFDPPQLDSIALAGTNLVITVDPRGNLAGLQVNAVTVALDESMDLVNWSRAGIIPRLENGRLIFKPVPGITNLFYRASVTASGN